MAAPRQANLQRIVQQIQRGALPEILAINMHNSVVAGLKDAGSDVERLARKMARKLEQQQIPSSRLKEANLKLASIGQNAIVSGWRSRLPVGAPPYRRGPTTSDRLSGLLGPALASPEMLRGTTARTISFLNVGYLNREARHWYRVNYGAFGPKATPSRPTAYPVTVDGQTVTVLQDESPPAIQSWLPRSYTSEGEVYFAPLKGPADRAGGGHRSALFTDLGLQAVARNFDPVYDNMLRSYMRARAEELGGERLVSRVNASLRRTRPTVT